MIGVVINVAGILIGGIAGLLRKKPFSVTVESWGKIVLGVLMVFCGLRLTVINLGGSLGQILKQLAIMILSMILGRLLGRLLRLQKMSNRIGEKAKQAITAAGSQTPRASEGFKTCCALFCAAPLGIVGSVVDGLSGYFYPLALKGLIDGLGTMGLVKVFGWGAILSALPVLAFQGTIALLCAKVLGPYLQAYALIPSVNAVSGMLIFTVALVILQIKRIEMADYIPSLAIAPLITALWR